ncbi:MAG: hypothetical protein ACLQVY_16435 [Limisphaerales bacterium]
MLYIQAMMNQKLNVPGEIFLGNKEYSWRMDWNVNGWLFVATLISSFADIIFQNSVKQWPLGWRVGLVFSQFAALLLWIRCLQQWIRGMDELHRRITVSAVFFAISATFFCVMLWHRLDAAGLFQACFSTRKHPNASWDIATVGHAFLLLTAFYCLGHSVFNRRYK